MQSDPTFCPIWEFCSLALTCCWTSHRSNIQFPTKRATSAPLSFFWLPTSDERTAEHTAPGYSGEQARALFHDVWFVARGRSGLPMEKPSYPRVEYDKCRVSVHVYSRFLIGVGGRGQRSKTRSKCQRPPQQYRGPTTSTEHSDSSEPPDSAVLYAGHRWY